MFYHKSRLTASKNAFFGIFPPFHKIKNKSEPIACCKRPIRIYLFWCIRLDSNQRHQASEACALSN